ncbi:MAG: flagellar M-ring protein FliF [Thermodesulfovibrio sp.]|nr:flagellar M-ring protein FliF [Thermodesulfovibrio sp.]
MANIIEGIGAMPLKNKAIVLAVLIIAVASIVLLFSWSQQADYHLLYANLSEGDSGPIAQKLKELKIPYRVEAGGILVPSDKVYEVRLQLAAQGLPHGGGIGFELFDKTDFGTTDFVQKLNYRRALQGELSRTIMSLSEVEQCRVHLAIPEKTLFNQVDNRPSASVLVKLRSGRTLAQNQVQGIVHMVSSSIEGMNPKDVTVVDARGDMLTRPGDDAAVGLSSSQLEYQRNLEKEIESRVVGILEPVIGKSKLRARVTANLDFTRSEKTEEKYDPDGQVIRSEQKQLEKTTAAGTGGVPGVASNIPGKAAAPQASGSQNQSQKQHDTTNYEISKVTSHVVNPTGMLKRLSVAVLVDGLEVAEKDAKEKKYTPRSGEDLKRYEELVKNAIGFTADRGDEVKIINMQFEGIPKEEIAPVPVNYMYYITTAAKFLVPLIGVLLLYIMILKPLLGTLSSVPRGSQAGGEFPLPQSVAQLEQAMKAKGIPMEQEVIDWAKKNPQQAASLIKGWLEAR